MYVCMYVTLGVHLREGSNLKTVKQNDYGTVGTNSRCSVKGSVHLKDSQIEWFTNSIDQL